MKTLINAVVIKNDWKLNKEYNENKGNPQKAHGLKFTFGEKDYTLDLSYIEPNMSKIIYAILPPIPFDTKNPFKIETIPLDADLYPYDIEVISGPGDKTDPTAPGVV